MTFFVNEALTV